MRKALTGAGALAALLVFVTAGGAVPFAGTIEASDPTQGQPIFLNGVASTCATPKGPQGSQGPAGGTTYHYDSYSFVNTTGSTQCVTVTLSQSGGTGSLQTAAYSGSFNPDEPWMNLLADPGEHTTGAGDSVSFSFTVAPGAAYVLVVHEAIANGCLGCTYTLNFGSSVLPAALRSATALRTAKGVLVRWRTGAEPELLGFHLYRLRAGSYSRLTRALLPARGTVAGAAYRYLDRAAPRKGVLRYRLQRVDVDGSRTWLGSVLKVRR